MTDYVGMLDELCDEGDKEACDLLADYATLAEYGHEDDPRWVALARGFVKRFVDLKEKQRCQ